MINSGEKKAIFGGSVEFVFSGREFGDCQFSNPGSLKNIADLRQRVGGEGFFAPWVNFTNKIEELKNLKILGDGANVIRTRESADGGIIDTPDLWLMINNADCHIGLIYDAENHRLCLIHLGLMCFHRLDGSPSIIENAICKLNVFVKRLQFWVGCGIGPCCNGYNVNWKYRQSVIEKFPDCVGGLVQKGPRRGQEAYDNLKMIVTQARQLGFDHIEIEDTCSSCHGVEKDESSDLGTFFSNVRDLSTPKKKSRNSFIARLAR